MSNSRQGAQKAAQAKTVAAPTAKTVKMNPEKSAGAKALEEQIKKGEILQERMKIRALHMQALEQLQKVEFKEEPPSFFVERYTSAPRFQFLEGRDRALVSISDPQMVTSILDFLKERIKTKIAEVENAILKDS